MPSGCCRWSQTVMTEAGLAFKALDRIAVTFGPGTFTGTRICVSAARALALATGAEIRRAVEPQADGDERRIPAAPTGVSPSPPTRGATRSISRSSIATRLKSVVPAQCVAVSDAARLAWAMDRSSSRGPVAKLLARAACAAGHRRDRHSARPPSRCARHAVSRRRASGSRRRSVRFISGRRTPSRRRRALSSEPAHDVQCHAVPESEARQHAVGGA